LAVVVFALLAPPKPPIGVPVICRHYSKSLI
jgi:hypothetical protein